MKFRSLDAKGRHTCGLTANGVAYCWGENKSGQLGNGTLVSAASPVPVSGNLKFSSLSAGFTHTCGIDTMDAAYCWGGNWHGQLGIGTLDGEQQYPCCRSSPVRVTGGLRVSSVQAGGIHTCGLTVSGEAYCWGNHKNFGQLGTADTDLRDRPLPVAVSGGHRFVSISAGIPSCGITATGLAYCWGGGAVPELGIRSNVERLDRPVEISRDLTFEKISASAFFACGIATGGHLYCWGYNRYGQMGNGSTETVDLPQLIDKEQRFRVITAGGNEFSGHACAIATDGASLCWGDNRWGQLGNGSITQVSRPTPVVLNAGTGR
jgi:alpha-tubulin suppressor-like RCC1 family protein